MGGSETIIVEDPNQAKRVLRHIIVVAPTRRSKQATPTRRQPWRGSVPLFEPSWRPCSRFFREAGDSVQHRRHLDSCQRGIPRQIAPVVVVGWWAKQEQQVQLQGRGSQQQQEFAVSVAMTLRMSIQPAKASRPYIRPRPPLMQQSSTGTPARSSSDRMGPLKQAPTQPNRTLRQSSKLCGAWIWPDRRRQPTTSNRTDCCWCTTRASGKPCPSTVLAPTRVGYWTQTARSFFWPTDKPARLFHCTVPLWRTSAGATAKPSTIWSSARHSFT